MVRTQIQLTEQQAQALKAAAEKNGVSMSEMIRQGVEIVLNQQHRPNRVEMVKKAAAAAGKFHSGHSDVSENHDTYLSGR
jgi:Arc/MetJ-type ribon-helix-helix transcriptional regulator